MVSLCCILIWYVPACGPAAPQEELTILTEKLSSPEPAPGKEAFAPENTIGPESLKESSWEPAMPEENPEPAADASTESDSRPVVEPRTEPALPDAGPPEQPAEQPAEKQPPEKPKGNAWIGEACTQDSDCNVPGGRCLKASDGYPGGHCTAACTSTCPDRSGKPYTFCISGASGTGRCVSQCKNSPCRQGYACQLRQRFKQASVIRNVCIPQSSNPGKQLTFLYIGDSQSSGSQFAKIMVNLLRNPSTDCSNPKTSNNTVFSYAKVSSASRHWSEPSGSSKSWLCRATKVYTNGTASSNTTGSKLCAGITSQSISIFQKLIANHKPSGFLIQLGGNSSGFSESYVKSRIKRMLDQMPPSSLCFWVTPSYGTKSLTNRRNVEKWTQEAIAAYSRIQCSVLTSIQEMSKQTTCSSFNSSDGVHMTTCGSRLWGQLIRQKICATGKL